MDMGGRCNGCSSVGSLKIKIRTSSRDKALLAFLLYEVKILIFDFFCDRCVTHNILHRGDQADVCCPRS
jgi:hypothetical protein